MLLLCSTDEYENTFIYSSEWKSVPKLLNCIVWNNNIDNLPSLIKQANVNPLLLQISLHISFEENIKTWQNLLNVLRNCRSERIVINVLHNSLNEKYAKSVLQLLNDSRIAINFRYVNNITNDVMLSYMQSDINRPNLRKMQLHDNTSFRPYDEIEKRIVGFKQIEAEIGLRSDNDMNALIDQCKASTLNSLEEILYKELNFAIPYINGLTYNFTRVVMRYIYSNSIADMQPIVKISPPKNSIRKNVYYLPSSYLQLQYRDELEEIIEFAYMLPAATAISSVINNKYDFAPLETQTLSSLLPSMLQSFIQIKKTLYSNIDNAIESIKHSIIKKYNLQAFGPSLHKYIYFEVYDMLHQLLYSIFLIICSNSHIFNENTTINLDPYELDIIASELPIIKSCFSQPFATQIMSYDHNDDEKLQVNISLTSDFNIVMTCPNMQDSIINANNMYKMPKFTSLPTQDGPISLNEFINVINTISGELTNEQFEQLYNILLAIVVQYSYLEEFENSKITHIHQQLIDIHKQYLYNSKIAQAHQNQYRVLCDTIIIKSIFIAECTSLLRDALETVQQYYSNIMSNINDINDPLSKAELICLMMDRLPMITITKVENKQLLNDMYQNILPKYASIISRKKLHKTLRNSCIPLLNAGMTLKEIIAANDVNISTIPEVDSKIVGVVIATMRYISSLSESELQEILMN